MSKSGDVISDFVNKVKRSECKRFRIDGDNLIMKPNRLLAKRLPNKGVAIAILARGTPISHKLRKDFLKAGYTVVTLE